MQKLTKIFKSRGDRESKPHLLSHTLYILLPLETLCALSIASFCFLSRYHYSRLFLIMSLHQLTINQQCMVVLTCHFRREHNVVKPKRNSFAHKQKLS